ncbi:MAG TPA: tail-specific protease, partial [Planctomycetaceae bacterium]|nr:tail-specific protease [Planctomycetaceae bacterium]
TPEELNERWRKRIKYELLLKKLDGTPLDKAREELHRRYKNIRTMMSQTEDFEKLETYLTALTHCFDPHSSYMSPQSLEEFRIAMELSLEGIGAALRWKDGYTVVEQIIPGGAADADGRLQVGDKIIAVAQGDDGEFVDVVEMKLTKVVRLIRGKRGTVVRLRVKKAETGETKIIALTRQRIELHEQEVKGEILPPERTNGKRIGVIHIPSFYRDFRGEQRGREDFKSAARDLDRVLRRFQQEGGVDGLIIDLRFNGGGALSEAIEVTGLFIDEGPVVQVKSEHGRIKIHSDPIPEALYKGPLVLVTNRLSASASEIFAGAIKDYQRGIIVGDTTTHGKGTVQNVMPVARHMFRIFDQEDRGALKLTIQQFYRVNGDSTQNRGVHSDLVLPSRLDHSDVGESFLKNALAFDRIAPVEHYSAGMVTPEMVNSLQRASQQRIQNDPEFRKLQKKIERFIERKNRSPGRKQGLELHFRIQS